MTSTLLPQAGPAIAGSSILTLRRARRQQRRARRALVPRGPALLIASAILLAALPARGLPPPDPDESTQDVRAALRDLDPPGPWRDTPSAPPLWVALEAGGGHRPDGEAAFGAMVMLGIPLERFAARPKGPSAPRVHAPSSQLAPGADEDVFASDDHTGPADALAMLSGDDAIVSSSKSPIANTARPSASSKLAHDPLSGASTSPTPASPLIAQAHASKAPPATSAPPTLEPPPRRPADRGAREPSAAPPASSSPPPPTAEAAADPPLHIPLTVSPAAARAAVDAALRRARLADPDARIDSIASRARTSALLPELRMRVSRTVEEGQTLSPTEYDPARTTASGGTSLWLEARATWRLDRLLFADEEVALERARSQLADTQRKLTERVLGLLFAWQRALALASDPAKLPEERLVASFTMVEAEVELDLLTGGWFTRWRAEHYAREGAAEP